MGCSRPKRRNILFLASAAAAEAEAAKEAVVTSEAAGAGAGAGGAEGRGRSSLSESDEEEEWSPPPTWSLSAIFSIRVSGLWPASSACGCSAMALALLSPRNPHAVTLLRKNRDGAGARGSGGGMRGRTSGVVGFYRCDGV